MATAPASLLATRINGESPVEGYRVTGFTDEEAEAVGLASRAPWLLEDEDRLLELLKCGVAESPRPRRKSHGTSADPVGVRRAPVAERAGPPEDECVAAVPRPLPPLRHLASVGSATESPMSSRSGAGRRRDLAQRVDQGVRNH